VSNIVAIADKFLFMCMFNIAFFDLIIFSLLISHFSPSQNRLWHIMILLLKLSDVWVAMDMEVQTARMAIHREVNKTC